MFQSVPTAPGELQISEKMANAITGWLLAFYQRPAWLEAGYRVTNAPINVTDYMSTLACNEIAMSAGASARGTWINDQLTRFLLPQLKNAVQLAGAGGRVVVKPYPSGRNIYCEIIPADRIYPTRINGAGVTEAGFFTDFAALRGRKVVRVEAWDLQPYGLYLQNRAYWYNTGDTLGGELALTDVPEWAGLEPEVVIRGVDRPLFGELRMPMANTVDETSKLPVSLYARAVDTMAELDRIYSEFLWEIHTGKRKRIVDRTAIKPDKSGGGVPFRDQTTDLYLSMDLTGDMGQGDPFRDYTPALRVEEYQKAIDIQCRLLERQTGFSPGTFSFDLKSGRMTATQVVSDDKETYNIAATGNVGQWLGFTFVEANGATGSIKYYDHTGAQKTVDMSKVQYVMYYHETLSVVSNFEVARIIDSERFAGSLAQVEMNTGYRVTNSKLARVRKVAGAG